MIEFYERVEKKRQFEVFDPDDLKSLDIVGVVVIMAVSKAAAVSGSLQEEAHTREVDDCQLSDMTVE